MDSEEELIRFRDDLGIDFPLLLDTTGEVHSGWLQDVAFPSAAFPQDWLIDPEGKVAYANNTYEPDEIRGLLDGWLTED